MPQPLMRGIDLARRQRHAVLHRLKIAHFRAGVGGAARLHVFNHFIQRALRVSNHATADTVAAKPGQRNFVNRVLVNPQSGKLMPRHGHRHRAHAMRGHKGFFDLH